MSGCVGWASHFQWNACSALPSMLQDEQLCVCCLDVIIRTRGGASFEVPCLYFKTQGGGGEVTLPSFMGGSRGKKGRVEVRKWRLRGGGPVGAQWGHTSYHLLISSAP